MSWNPKRYDPPGHEPEAGDEPEKCPKCSWAEWETFVWLFVGTVAFYLGLYVLIGSHR